MRIPLDSSHSKPCTGPSWPRTVAINSPVLGSTTTMELSPRPQANQSALGAPESVGLVSHARLHTPMLQFITVETRAPEATSQSLTAPSSDPLAITTFEFIGCRLVLPPTKARVVTAPWCAVPCLAHSPHARSTSLLRVVSSRVPVLSVQTVMCPSNAEEITFISPSTFTHSSAR